MGAPPEVITALKADQGEEPFPVWLVNQAVVEAFLAVCTQWRAIARGMDGQVYWQGLDYAGVAAGLAGAGITQTPELWAGLRVMEAAARNQLNGIRDSD